MKALIREGMKPEVTGLQMLNAELANLYHQERDTALKLSEEKTIKEAFIKKAGDYTIHKTETGATVYRLQDPLKGCNDNYYLCANCFQNEKISILQPSAKIVTIFNCPYISAYCPACSAEFIMHSAPSESLGSYSTHNFRLK
ncbi:hypothetical protein [Escherichia coli]|uniref:hypothetical protein n=1 Tax=Escherichia coli TaxID=562 RepID=UPI001124E225|nr:hypothetical protein [Escherichia coli]